MTETKVKRAADYIGPWLQDALDRMAEGDEVIWDFGPMAAVQDDQGNVTTPAGLVVAIWMEGMVLGTVMCFTFSLLPLKLTPDHVSDAVQNALTTLRGMRSRQADEILAEAKDNGQRPEAP